MAFDEQLAGRIRDVLGARPGLTEKKMFGGIAFMLNGNMCCGIVKNDLMVRVGPQGHDQALAQPYALPMDFTHRPMKGMVYVSPEGLRTEAALGRWVQRGLDFAASLPPK